MKASIKIDDSTIAVDQGILKTKSYRDSINEFYPTIVNNLIKQYQCKSIRVKVTIMKTFSILVMLMPQNKLEEHLGSIMNEIVKSVSESNNDLITHSLSILKTAFKNSSPQNISVTANRDSGKIANFLQEALKNN